MPAQDWSNLKRPRHPMPEFIRRALEEHGLMEKYKARPPYQQNDYLDWINRAKRETTKKKRLGQMLAELKKGDVYMRMEWNSRGN